MPSPNQSFKKKELKNISEESKIPLNELKKILDEVKPKIVIINGDLKHEFGRISDQEWRDTLKLIDFILKHCKKIMLRELNNARNSLRKNELYQYSKSLKKKLKSKK